MTIGIFLSEATPKTMTVILSEAKNPGGERVRRLPVMTWLALPASAATTLWIAGCRPDLPSNHKETLMYKPTAVWDAAHTGTELDKILGIGLDNQGRVYATAGKGDKGVLVFDGAGRVVDAWGEGFADKHGLRIFGDRVWVTDRQRHIVMEFTLDGRLLRTLGTDGHSGPADNQFDKPADVAVAPNGDIYIADGYGNSRVMRFAADGRLKQSWGTKGAAPGQFDVVHNIVIDRTGRVLVADRENRRIQLFDLDGRYIEQWTHVGKPFGLALDDQNRIYTTDGQSNCVYVLDRDGGVLAQFGRTGTGPGEFQVAHSIAVDKQGNIYVAEGDGMRIQLFTLQNSADKPNM